MQTIYTIGHSTHTIDHFIGMLVSAGITMLVDVRSIPGSAKNPQFSQETFKESLNDAGIQYCHFPALGGYRPKSKTVAEHFNAGWQNKSFKNYADYTMSDDFALAVSDLIYLTEPCRVAICCSESVPYRCHRTIISDNLLARGCPVMHVMGVGKFTPHIFGKWGAVPKVDGRWVTYPTGIGTTKAQNNELLMISE